MKVTWPLTAVKWMIYGLLVIVPLYVGSSHFFPYTTPKSLISIGLGLGIGALLLYDWYINNQKSTHLTILHGALWIYIASLVISAVAGFDPKLSLFGSLVDGVGVNLMIALAIVALAIARSMREDKGFLRTMILVSFGTSSVVAIGTYLNTMFSSSSGGSTFGNTSYVGAYLLVNLCLGLYLALSSKSTTYRVLVGGGMAVSIFSPIFFNKDILTGSIGFKDIVQNPSLVAGSADGAFLGLVVAGSIIAIFFLLTAKKKKMQYVGAVLLLLGIIGGLAIGNQFFDPNARLHQVYVQEKNTNRFVFWDIAREGYSEKSLLGWGMNNYSYVFQKHFDPVFFSNTNAYEPWTDHPHNMFWEYVVNGGAVGLLTYMAFLGTILICLYRVSARDRDNRTIAIVVLGAMVGYIIQGLFIFESPGTLLMFFSMIGITIGLYQETVSATCSVRCSLVDTHLSFVGIFAGAVLLVIGCIQPWQESTAWTQYPKKDMLISENKKNPQTISYLGYANDSAIFAGKIFDIIRSKLSTMTDDQKHSQLRIVNNLITNLDQDIGVNNYAFRARWVSGQLKTLSVVLAGVADPEVLGDARSRLESARMINSTNANLYFDIVQTYLFEKDYRHAWQYLRAGIALAPQYQPGYRTAEKMLQTASPRDRAYIGAMQQRWMSQK